MLFQRRTAGGGGGEVAVDVIHVVIAGWTGRDQADVERHIAELEAIGIPRPSRTPYFYRVAASLVTTAAMIEVAGHDTSGEAEFFVLSLDDGLWIGAGSDHTDRKLEAHGVTKSKQACAKPVAPVLWPLDELAGHWDRLVVRSYVVNGSDRALYQEGLAATLLAPDDLVRRYAPNGGGLAPGTLMLCGTMAVEGGVREADSFEFELDDPVLDRKISHRYAIRPLPLED